MAGAAAAFGVNLDDSYLQHQNYPIWPENVEAAELFFACQRQWRLLTSSSGGVLHLGLDYPAVHAIRVEMEMAPDRDRLEKIRAIERGALEVMNRQ